MVKFHTFSDRTVRYDLRCDKKFRTEMKNKIDIKNKEIHYVMRDNVETINKLKRLTTSYNFVYQNYTDLYNTYCRLVADYNTLKKHEVELINENSSLRNENERLLQNTESNPTENLESVNTLEDWETLEQTRADPFDEYYKNENTECQTI
jgi:regulator of replication initiation timing